MPAFILIVVLVAAGLILIWPRGAGDGTAFAGALLLAVAVVVALAGA